MRKIIPIISILLITLVSTIGCYPGDSAAPKTSAVQADMDKLKTEVAAMAGTINGLVPRVGSLEGRPQGGKDFTSEIAALTTKNNDAQTSLGKLEARIKLLEDWKTAGGSSGSSGGFGGTPSVAPVTGQVTYTTNPTPLQQLFTASTGSNTYYFTVRVNNGMNAWQYIKPILTLSTTSGYSAGCQIQDANISMSYSGYTSTGNKNPIGPTMPSSQIQFTPMIASNITTNSLTAIPLYGGLNGLGEIQVASGQFVDILVTISVQTNVPVIWQIGFSLSNRGI
jgi:hypothetical protein